MKNQDDIKVRIRAIDDEEIEECGSEDMVGGCSGGNGRGGE